MPVLAVFSIYYFNVIMSIPPKKSVVHNHFSMYDKHVDGTYQAKCDHCGIVLKGAKGGSTTNLLKHLKVNRNVLMTDIICFKLRLNTVIYTASIPKKFCLESSKKENQ